MDLDLKALTDIAKIAVPAVGAWLAAWLTNRRERRQWIEKRESEQQAALSVQSDRLTAGWAEMTTQAREIITRLQVETIDAKTRCAMSEARTAGLERELADVKQKYEEALRELSALRNRAPKPRPRDRDRVGSREPDNNTPPS